MFRKPQDNSTKTTDSFSTPSTGRPPTPPSESSKTQQPTSTMPPRSANKPSTPKSKSKPNASISSKQSVKKPSTTKATQKPNGNILNFFKKVDSPLKDDSIFVPEKPGREIQMPRTSTPDLFDGDDVFGDNNRSMGGLNDPEESIKKRKLSGHLEIGDWDSIQGAEVGSGSSRTPSMPTEPCTPAPSHSPMQAKDAGPKAKKPRRLGPFLDDSDSDEEVMDGILQRNAVQAEKKELNAIVYNQSDAMNEIVETKPINQKDIMQNKPTLPSPASVLPMGKPLWKRHKRVPINPVTQATWESLNYSSKKESLSGSQESFSYDDQESAEKSRFFSTKGKDLPKVPALKKEPTSIDVWSDFESMGEFSDEDIDGEEFKAKLWIQEQAMMEATDVLPEDEESFNDFNDDEPTGNANEEGVPNCPICDANLKALTDVEASEHVNACLDGNPLPIPSKAESEPAEVKLMPEGAKNRFARKAAIPRPGQANPINLGNEGGSAFAKIMSGHAEDAAWASAANAEKSSRGKPAFQRTCPFYKIMPGFFICVDAFRYGAVQGCNAYFLSHFHSDHYIGLSSTWSHGPIYCSKVTGNLVKQQLKVDAKWVKHLDFEDKFEIPDTQGAWVTMIPANHCPGSSLFLFERALGRGRNPKIQRILHCGDFRACPAHISHPQLMPNVVDSISGKTKQQKIDVCYLDTTYLNPRYAFPSQEDVINACADMCVSLTKENAEESDAWETAKRERAGAGMTKFIKSASSKSSDAIGSSKQKPRGRLLVICGTYSIGKERICLGIARALDCKIYAPPGKMRICAALEDPELASRMTSDPREAQIHMQMLMEIRPETLQEYLNSYKPHFTRIVAFRPSGWSYKPPSSRLTDSPPLKTILHADSWRSKFAMGELVPQRGSTREAQCFGVPYSEHSSFRELTMFVMGLRIEKVVPTVNVGSEVGRKKMKTWVDRWLAERRKNGVLNFVGEKVEGDDESKEVNGKMVQEDGLVKW